MNRYDRYFAVQVGRGVSSIGSVYRTNRYQPQTATGLSDVFSNLFRFIQPYLVSGARAVGGEALRSGQDILSNLGQKPIKELLKEQADKSFKNLAEKAENKVKNMMSGKGIKRRRPAVEDFIMSLNQQQTASKRRRTASKSRVSKSSKKGKRKTKKRVVKGKGLRKKSSKSKISKSAFLKKYLK